jgi:hypothetical protein
MRPGRQAILGWSIILATMIQNAPLWAHDEPWQPHEESAAYRSECGVCHVAFPPALLPTDDWLAILSQLERHYGANAGLEEKTHKEIAGFLQRNGANGPSVGDRDDAPRITNTDWFVRKHPGVIRRFQKGQLKSLVDCGACHKGPDIDKMTSN